MPSCLSRRRFLQAAAAAGLSAPLVRAEDRPTSPNLERVPSLAVKGHALADGVLAGALGWPACHGY